jgi:P2 family phage contractile tail tube protein
VPLKIVVKAMPSTNGIGKFATGEPMETKKEMSVMYIKITYKDKEHLEYDPLNYIYKVGGEDFLEKVRANLGL